MNIELLRQATRADHDAVEKALPLMADDLTLHTYICVLQRIRSLIADWERLGEESAPEWMQPMMKLRQRGSLLEEDLHLLAPELEAVRTTGMPTFTTAPDFLGAMYVIEGSRLGGLLIAHHVGTTLGLVEGEGNAYFRGSGRQTSSLWKEFLDILRAQVPDAHAAEVIAAAQRMFRFFAHWMSGDLAEEGR